MPNEWVNLTDYEKSLVDDLDKLDIGIQPNEAEFLENMLEAIDWDVKVSVAQRSYIHILAEKYHLED